MISLTYIGSIFVSSVSGVVPSTPAPAGLYLRIHFTHQIQESHLSPQSFYCCLFQECESASSQQAI
ncbi:hypothetical protein PN482_17545 [Microcystis aeruginosa CS-555/01A07]|uniref:Similarity n=1 Tax=Microcystis aeruginosa (strain PCC 7806) TaxID=267872 RepID=A8YEA4_MICA7|nr:hypothetical protein [Microcystis aeruginosa]MDB9430648.1 hypothetical protein [Microcystis aeruginosa CS-555/01A07]CAO86978.1 unnamed protein product [Microcystis aeruginosa PCC 7806]